MELYKMFMLGAINAFILLGSETGTVSAAMPVPIRNESLRTTQIETFEESFFLGCWKDATNCDDPRDLPFFPCLNTAVNSATTGCCKDSTGKFVWAGSQAMVPQLCLQLCKGYKFMGLGDGGICFCGNSYG
eukprot:gene25519-31184_t